MKWTKVKPRAPGWYWFRHTTEIEEYEPDVVEIQAEYDGKLTMSIYGDSHELETFEKDMRCTSYEFGSEPIPAPDEIE